MSSTLEDRQSLKRKADDAMLIDSPRPPPDTKSINLTPTEKPGHFVSRPGPVDNETILRTEIRLNRILQARTQIIREWIAAAAALEYKSTDLAKNVVTTKEVIIEGIKTAMVRR